MSNFCVGITFSLIIALVCGAKNPTSQIEIEEDHYEAYKDDSWSDPLDWKILKAFASKDYKNVLVSPLSLKIVLALLYEGAGGDTEAQLQIALDFPKNKTLLREKYANIISTVQGERDEYVFNIATRMFLDSSVEPFQAFAAKAKNYSTDIAKVNFLEAKDACNTINTWIDTSTNGRIKKLVTPSDIENAVLVLSNVLYFKGLWRLEFPKNQTHKGGFYVTPEVTIQDVTYMSNTEKYYYTESTRLDAKIVRIPYKGQKFALFIVLPNSKGGLEELLRILTLDQLRNVINLMEESTVNLVIPKFKFDFQASFASLLQDLGVRNMFSDSASLPGIARGMANSRFKALYVSDILQKAGIEITEEGSVVYAATEITLGNKFGEVQNTFSATRPFLFFIEEQQTKTILFLGKVENPLQSEPINLPPRFNDEGKMKNHYKSQRN